MELKRVTSNSSSHELLHSNLKLDSNSQNWYWPELNKNSRSFFFRFQTFERGSTFFQVGPGALLRCAVSCVLCAAVCCCALLCVQLAVCCELCAALGDVFCPTNGNDSLFVVRAASSVLCAVCVEQLCICTIFACKLAKSRNFPHEKPLLLHDS